MKERIRVFPGGLFEAMSTALASSLSSSRLSVSLGKAVAFWTSFLLSSCIPFESALEAWNRPTERSSAPHKPNQDTLAKRELEVTGPRDDAHGLSSGPNFWARWNAFRGDAYALDEIDRFVDPAAKKRPPCDPSAMVTYRGETLRYQGGAVTVSAPFRERLARFEQVVAEVATETYGRAPSRIIHFGAYACRVSRNRSQRLSEHALGNAIDIVGFDFRALGKDQALHLPKQLRGPLQVRVAKHWYDSGKPPADVHSRFLRTLTERLRERGDVFRGMIGPSRRDHADHLHLDVSPWRYDWL
jgi:hypothetical protein